MKPTQRPSGNGDGTPIATNASEWAPPEMIPRMARDAIAAGLLDRQIPDPQDLALAIGREDRTDVSPQFRPFGDEIEGEQPDREDLEDRVGDGRADVDGP